MSELHTQVIVSTDPGIFPGEMVELFIWQDDFNWQGGFAKNDTGWWLVLETKDDSDFLDLGSFDTLALALEAYRSWPDRACPQFLLNNSDRGVALENFIIG